MRKALIILIAIIVCLLIGFTGRQAQELSLETWYPTLHKSSLTPPNLVFPVAWSILYLLMGISIGLILVSKTQNKYFLVILFCVQLALNWLWSILFFSLQNPALGLADIITLAIVVALYAIVSWRNHKTSSILFWPYMAWLLFATYLNFYIMINN